MKPRVLVILSVNDLGTVRAGDSLRLLGNHATHEVYYCYAVDMTEYAEQGDYSVQYETLLERLLYSVSTTRPEILVLHTGVAFLEQPEYFVRALTVVRTRYPGLEMFYEQPRKSSEFLHSKRGSSTEEFPLRKLLDDSAIFSGSIDYWFSWLHKLMTSTITSVNPPTG